MRRMLLFMVLLAGTAMLSSCNILTPIAYVLAPEPMVDPLYELQDRPTVVFVDDRRNVVTPTSLRRVIAARVSEDLMVNEVVATTINPQDAEAIARQNDTDEQVLAIDEVGRAVGAEQVIYIEMLEFRDRTDPYTPKPRGACRIRVIDVVKREKVYPGPDSQDPAHLVTVELPQVDPNALKSRATRNQVGMMLAEKLGQDVGRVFYRWNASELGKSLGSG